MGRVFSGPMTQERIQPLKLRHSLCVCYHTVITFSCHRLEWKAMCVTHYEYIIIHAYCLTVAVLEMLFLLQLLAVELLNVLHRLLLTRDPPAVQLQVTAVVQETIRAAQEHLQRQRASRGQQLTHATCSALFTLQ